MIVLDPKYTQPKLVECDKCKRHFLKNPYTGVYSDGHGGLLTLCPDCAASERSSGNVLNILH